MKYLIASDLHGSAYYCERMLQAFQTERADKIIFLGDILYHGPRNDLPKDYNPKKVIGLLNDYKDKIYCVRGNCEAEVDQMVLDFPVMADYALFHQNEITVYATHGHIFNEDNLPPLVNGDILLYGHTHVPCCQSFPLEKGNFIYINPGSLALPKENSWHGYILWENKHFIWKDIDGMVKKEFSL